jgi:hypothetical protein
MARCLTPFQVQLENGNIQNVPCGKCPGCYKARVSAWSFRLVQEAKISSSAYMLTLTYDDHNIPYSPNGLCTTVKRDVQLFIKRLRKAHVGNSTLKYYCVGEYGGATQRPHYHILMFNAVIELIQPAWKLGIVHYGDDRGVCEAAAGYCLKYMDKSSSVGKHHLDDRQKEFALMSKGLGKVTSPMLLKPGIQKMQHACTVVSKMVKK